MNSLAGALRPWKLANSPVSTVSSLRPVSRISFSLTDSDAFNQAAQFAVRWLAEKAGGVLPGEATQLRSFDTRGMHGYHPCHVVRLDDENGSIWAARIDEPGSKKDAGETWSTEIFVEGGPRRLVRFGAQLTSRRPTTLDALRLSRPRVVHDLLRELSAEEDDEPLRESVTKAEVQDAEWLASLITRPQRRLPVVAVATDDQWRGKVDLRQLAVRLSGAAHLVAMNPDATWELTRIVGKRMSTFNGAIRIYMPGVADEDDPFRHPLFLGPTIGSNSGLLDVLAERIFPLGFRDRDGEGHFWRLAQLRQVSSEAESRLKTGTETDKLKRTIAARDDEIAELRESLETASALEKIAAENETAARHQVEQLKSENDRLRARLYAFDQAKLDATGGAVDPTDRPLASYDDLGDWAEEVLGPHIVLHPRALKECRQNGHPDMLRRIESTLLAIRDLWIPHKLNGGIEMRDAARIKLAELGVEDEPCFSRRDKAKEKPEYSVPDGRLTRVLYDHFKYGNSRNNAEQFRIYYAWDLELQKLLIGKMPSHLPNDQS